MSSQVVISRVDALPPDLDTELLKAAAGEGFEPLQWLVADWEGGRNRFSKPGEAFYAARVDGRLVGVCGVNRDPYADEARVGRLRRLYVLPDARRKGVGRQLVRRALEDASAYFTAMRLRTLDHDSALFFEAIGFGHVEGEKAFTHMKALVEVDGT